MRGRLGSIAFINSLPVDLGILSGSVACDADIFQEVPARLNEMLSSGQLDLSPISTFWYASHASQLLILPDLSISSESGVQSVLLFSKKPLSELQGSEIFVTPQGRTTPALLEILCQKKYGFKPRLRTMESASFASLPTAESVLLIGDEALKAKQPYESQGWHTTDLAQEWRNWTGKPFVFALWAVQRSFYATNPEKTHQLHQTLLESRQWGLANPAKVTAAACQQSGLGEDVVSAYFDHLSYGFNASHQEGLLLFLEHCHELGLLNRVPELEMILSESGQLKEAAR